MPTFRAVLRATIVFGFVFVASIPAAEVLFRFLDGAPGAELNGLFTRFGPDSYKMRAGVDTNARYPWGTTWVYTDSLGLRCDRDRRFGLAPGAHVDTLVLGDSQMFGNGLQYEATLAGHLAAQGTVQNLRVGNGAVNGHTVIDQLEIARWLAETNHVSIDTYVLVMTCIMVKVPAHYYQVKVGGDGRLYSRGVRWWMPAVMWLRTHSAAYGRISKARLMRPAAENRELLSIFLERFGTDVSETAEAGQLTAALQRFKDWVQARKAKLLIVYLPIPLEIEPGPALLAAQKKGIPVDVSRPRKICERVARQLELPFQDLFPEVHTFHAQGHTLNLKGDLHYTPEFWAFCWRDVWRFVFPNTSFSGAPLPFPLRSPEGSRRGNAIALVP